MSEALPWIGEHIPDLLLAGFCLLGLGIPAWAVWDTIKADNACEAACAPDIGKRLDHVGCLCNTAHNVWTREAMP